MWVTIKNNIFCNCVFHYVVLPGDYMSSTARRKVPLTECQCFLYVTHLHDISRMSAPYKLRKWAICMIWADNCEFKFLSNFNTLKHRMIILRPEMKSTPQHKSEMTYCMMLILLIYFQNGRWRQSWIWPIFKKRSKLTKVHPIDSESRNPGL